MKPHIKQIYNTICLAINFMPAPGRRKEDRLKEDIDERLYALEEQIRVLSIYIRESDKEEE